MVHNGKRYNEEFKRQIIDLYLSSKSIAQLAEECGLVEQTIYKWKKLYAPSIEVLITNVLTIKNPIEMLKIKDSMRIFWRFTMI